MEDRFVRPQGCAEGLREKALSPQGLLDKHVVVTGETTTCRSSNGWQCFLDIVRLLPRFCRHVHVVLPPGLDDLLEDTRALLEALGFGGSVSLEIGAPSSVGADAYLCVGAHYDSTLPMTVVNSNGWTARVSSDGSLSSDCSRTNPIAALAAACFGCVEVFKRLVDLEPGRGRLLPPTAWSLHTQKPGEDPGPELPETLDIDALLVGLGAIGNGIVHLLRALSFQGRVQLVDNQAYGVENIGTSLLVGHGDLGHSKAEVAAGWLRSDSLKVDSFVGTIAELAGSPSCRFPKAVLGALDNIDARRDLQRLFWPDLLIDGAIGDFEVQVSRHTWPSSTACLMCVFPLPAGPKAETVQARETGLSVARLGDVEDVVGVVDVQSAPTEKRAWLGSQIGKRICSVVNEAMMAKIARDESSQTSRPSVPFVACLSSCVVVAELVKATMAAGSELDPRYSFDALQGPQHGQMFPEDRQPHCECVTSQAEIELFRVARAAPTTAGD